MSSFVLVTGACGYTGIHLVNTLISKGYRVRATDIREPPAPSKISKKYKISLDERAEFVRADICDYSACEALVAGRINVVFHIGALVPFNASKSYSREAIFNVNVNGTRNLLEASKKSRKVHSFIYSSSTGVVFYGYDNAGIQEDDNVSETKWNDDYSESKALAEQSVLESNDHGFSTIALRPNGIWGPGENHHIPKLLVVAQLGFAAFTLAPDKLTDFTHRDNLISAFICSMEGLADAKRKKKIAGRAFFITDPWPVATQEFFAPLLNGIGFVGPNKVAILKRGDEGAVTDGQVKVFKSHWNTVSQTSGWEILSGKRKQTNLSSANEGSVEYSSLADYVTLSKEVQYSQTALGRDHVIITSKPIVPVPGWVMYFVAIPLEALSFILRPVYNFEAFLTLADVRKVVKHNYYSSKRAYNELGWTPVTTPAAGMYEVVAYLKDVGYDGDVPQMPLIAWILAPGGLAVTALLGYDVGNMLTATLSRLSSIVGDKNIDLLGISFSTNDILTVDVLSPLICIIFWGAMLCHLIQGIWVFQKAWNNRMNAGMWGYLSFMLGFASTSRLYEVLRRARKSNVDPQHVMLICIGLFLACTTILGLISFFIFK
jgi:sterol-4alpha-carboxylate 3-dehydrogenase (decarboxylating)